MAGGRRSSRGGARTSRPAQQASAESCSDSARDAALHSSRIRGVLYSTCHGSSAARSASTPAESGKAGQNLALAQATASAIRNTVTSAPLPCSALASRRPLKLRSVPYGGSLRARFNASFRETPALRSNGLDEGAGIIQRESGVAQRGSTTRMTRAARRAPARRTCPMDRSRPSSATARHCASASLFC